MGNKIPFTRYFYEYTPSRPSKDIIQEILAIKSKVDGVMKKIFYDMK